MRGHKINGDHDKIIKKLPKDRFLNLNQPIILSGSRFRPGVRSLFLSETEEIV